VIVLLDLNHTLVANSHVKLKPFSAQVDQEEYREELLELLRPHRVFLLTARPPKYREQTLARIRLRTGWAPERAFFNDGFLPPPEAKDRALRRFILPVEPGPFFAIESNPKTRTMYAGHGIPAVTAEQAIAAGEIGHGHPA
jgi:hypothetical protein